MYLSHSEYPRTWQHTNTNIQSRHHSIYIYLSRSEYPRTRQHTDTNIHLRRHCIDLHSDMGYSNTRRYLIINKQNHGIYGLWHWLARLRIYLHLEWLTGNNQGYFDNFNEYYQNSYIDQRIEF